MLLEVQERLALMELLPREGDYAAIKETRRAREMINFAPEENEALEFEDKGGGILVWNLEKGSQMVRDLPVSSWTMSTIQQALINLSNEKKLKDSHRTLYEKFVINYE